MKVKTVLLLLIAAIVALFVVGAVLFTRGADTLTLSSGVVLEIDLTQGFAEDAPPDALGLALIETRPRLAEVVAALERASRDRRVLGLVARIGASPGGLATLQELRDALVELTNSGKHTMAHAETFGEFGAANGGYYLATAFDEIFLQPSGDVGLTGLHYEVPFLAGTLEKLGVKAQMGQRHEFKNAVNSYTEKGFTEPHAEAMLDLATSQFDQIVRGIAEGRELSEERVRELVDDGPHLGIEAVSVGLVDRLAYRDEVYEEAESRWGEDVEYRDFLEYAEFRAPRIGADTIALIYGVGAISRGEGGYDPLTGTARLGADTVAQAFRDAVEDSDVRAILFRVNSPGGSYVASDTIWRETVRARQAGKPVVASFGDVAGSGGYFVAMSADHIVAQPGTITGSIGVYGGKLASRDFWSKLGMTFDAVSTSENADMWSGLDEFDELGWKKMEASLDRIYADFVGKVAEGRGMTLEQVEEVARGRIWTGERALSNGLVDELGGFPVAYSAVRRQLELPDDAPLAVRIFPRPKRPWEVFVDRLSSLDAAAGARLGPAGAERLREVIGRLGGAVEPKDVLEMPFVPELR